MAREAWDSQEHKVMVRASPKKDYITSKVNEVEIYAQIESKKGIKKL
jgi:hypothetical protein